MYIIFFRSFSNLNPSQEEEVDSPLRGDEQISLTQTSISTQSLPTQTSTTTPTALPIPSPCNALPQYPTTTRRGKRPYNRDKIADNLEKREAERNEIMRALLVQETEDDVDLFFKSLAKSVKKFTAVLQERAKAETLNVITRLETEMWKPIPVSYTHLLLCYVNQENRQMRPNHIGPYHCCQLYQSFLKNFCCKG